MPVLTAFNLQRSPAVKGSLYRVLRPVLVGVFWVAVRQRVLRRELVRREGPFILAVSHLSHYDPTPLAVAVRRPVTWMARKESFAALWSSTIMNLFGAFSIDRTGPALPGIREALRRLEQGKLVGIFPEGEVMSGKGSVLNGGPIKYGALWVARRAGVPVVPCVVLGSQGFRSVLPWLPLKLGRTWVAFGEPIQPNLEVQDSREGRRLMGEELAEALRALHRELGETYSIPPRYHEV